jgi:rfaE bifunctional protein kinase chain/domain
VGQAVLKESLSPEQGSSLEALLASCVGRRVLVVGDVMVDEYLFGESTRVSPDAGVPVVKVLERQIRAGGAAHAATTLAALGARCFLVGVVGDDAAAGTLRTLLRQAGVEFTLPIDGTRPTTVKSRVFIDGRVHCRLDFEETHELREEPQNEVLAALADRLPRAQAALVSDYAKGLLTPTLWRRTRALTPASCPLVVDPKTADPAFYRGATVVTPNLAEFQGWSGRETSTDAELALAAGELLPALAGTALLVTRGADGLSLFARGARPLHLRARPTEARDVAGAGDVLAATLALGLSAGAVLDQGADLANRAAGLAVRRFGPVPLGHADLLELLRDEF